MTATTTIHPRLIRAYREANYVVESTQPIILQLGQPNQALKRLLQDRKVSTGSFITAFNPYSRVTSEDQNQAAQKSLLLDIQRLGLETINGYGQDQAEKWPKENSLFALGITQSQAESLADKYGQNGYLWVGSLDALPILKLCHPIGLPTKSDLDDWFSMLPERMASVAKTLPLSEQAWLISLPLDEQGHWLEDQDLWSLAKPWPLTKPDGSPMGVGTELDRIFKLIAAMKA